MTWVLNTQLSLFLSIFSTQTFLHWLLFTEERVHWLIMRLYFVYDYIVNILMLFDAMSIKLKNRNKFFLWFAKVNLAMDTWLSLQYSTMSSLLWTQPFQFWSSWWLPTSHSVISPLWCFDWKFNIVVPLVDKYIKSLIPLLTNFEFLNTMKPNCQRGSFYPRSRLIFLYHKTKAGDAFIKYVPII